MPDDDHSLLGRIDERVKSLQKSMVELKEELEKYVLHIRFRPVEAGFYGLAAIILSSVIAAIVALVIRK